MTSPNFRPEDILVDVGGFGMKSEFHPKNLVQYLTAIEERLAKLEGSAVKVEYAPYKLDQNGNWDVEMKGDGEWKTVKPHSKIRAVDPNTGKEIPPTAIINVKPRICPVTGMFLDEPLDEFYFVTSWLHVEFIRNIDEPTTFQALVEAGNCFATREDAERYAKHLKAMAKLRRLGGYSLHKGYSAGNKIFTMVIHQTINEQLTPEEQNALLWPNEEK